jgi:hypothetical protein
MTFIRLPIMSTPLSFRNMQMLKARKYICANFTLATWRRFAYVALGLFTLFSFPALADTHIAVLDFELNDLTLLPRTPEELERTASVAPLLREALAKKGYELVFLHPEIQEEANVSFGYLFDHPEIAAELGRRFGAGWIAIGRVYKPSFLFAYLKVRLVNVKTQRLVGDYVVEVKGCLKMLTERGAASLADQINQTVNPKAEVLHKSGTHTNLHKH